MVVLDDDGVFSSDHQNQLYREYDMTRAGVLQDIQTLKEWILKQPHLPDISKLDLDKWLEGILLLTKNSVERAKHAVDSYFTAKTTCSSVFKHRSTQDPDIKDSFKYVKMALLPGLSPEGHRVLLMQISADATLYNLQAHMKRCSMVMDYYLRRGVDFTGLHVIHDLQHVGLGHLSCFSLPLMRTMAVGMKAYPCRIPKITIINTPYFLDKVIGLFRPFMSPKLMARVTSYKDASQLLDILPSRLVPKDYGGQASSLDDLNEFWRMRMEENSEFFALCDSLQTDENKRIGKQKSPSDNPNNQFGQDGTFRQLCVD